MTTEKNTVKTTEQENDIEKYSVEFDIHRQTLDALGKIQVPAADATGTVDMTQCKDQMTSILQYQVIYHCHRYIGGKLTELSLSDFQKLTEMSEKILFGQVAKEDTASTEDSKKEIQAARIQKLRQVYSVLYKMNLKDEDSMLNYAKDAEDKEVEDKLSKMTYYKDLINTTYELLTLYIKENFFDISAPDFDFFKDSMKKKIKSIDLILSHNKNYRSYLFDYTVKSITKYSELDSLDYMIGFINDIDQLTKTEEKKTTNKDFSDISVKLNTIIDFTNEIIFNDFIGGFEYPSGHEYNPKEIEGVKLSLIAKHLKIDKIELLDSRSVNAVSLFKKIETLRDVIGKINNYLMGGFIKKKIGLTDTFIKIEHLINEIKNDPAFFSLKEEEDSFKLLLQYKMNKDELNSMQSQLEKTKSESDEKIEKLGMIAKIGFGMSAAMLGIFLIIGFYVFKVVKNKKMTKARK